MDEIGSLKLPKPPKPDVCGPTGTGDYFNGYSLATLQDYAREAIEADRNALDDTVLTCDSCGVICQNPWHTSHGENRHLHLCDACYEADRQARGNADASANSGEPVALMMEAAQHLTNWLDMDNCECDGYSHSCGKAQVELCRDRLLAAAPQPQQTTVKYIPEGYALVPVELTKEMLHAAATSGGLGMDYNEYMGRFTLAYKAAIKEALKN